MAGRRAGGVDMQAPGVTPEGGDGPRRMRMDDVPAVASLHASALPELFTTALGERFLRAFYAEAVRRGEPAYVVGNDAVAGFVMGTLDERGLYRSFARRSAPAIAFATVRAICRSPSLCRRVARAAAKPVSAPRTAVTASLMFVAVAERGRRGGAGRALVRAFVEDVTARGARTIELETGRDANEVGNSFYRRLGFELAGVRQSGDRWSNIYVLSLTRLPSGTERIAGA